MIYTLGVGHPDFQEVSKQDIYTYFEDSKSIQLDTETTGKDPHADKIVSLQLGDRYNQYFIDCRQVDVRDFKELIESKQFLLQNAKFDYKMLKAAGIDLENIYDTMLAEAVLYCGYEKWGYGLDKLVERYIHTTMSKEERMGFTSQGTKPYTKKQIEYGCLDVTYLEDIRKKQSERLRILDLEYCLALENEVVKALGDIEYNGMGFNPAKWKAITQKTITEVEQLSAELDAIVLNDKKLAKKFRPVSVQQDLFGEKVRELRINYASPLQIKLICKTLGFEVDSTNEKELTKLQKKHVFFEKLIELRGKNKIVSTYGDNFLEYINPITKRIHTSFWQVKDTGRVASGSKDDNAPNVQNIPAKNDFRNCFEAREGFSWISIDYSGQELRLMADASDENGFIDVLNRGEDLHCYAGSMMFKKPVTKEDKDLRNKAKTINFGKPYGMGVNKLADTLQISEEEAEDLFTEYAKAFPKLNKWLEDQGKFAKDNHYSVTFAPCKRRRFFPDMEEADSLRKKVQRGERETWKRIFIIEGQTERNGGNSPIQGSGADICKEALVEVRKLIKEYNTHYKAEVAFLICTVHDAIDFEVRDDLAQEFAKKAEDIMIECGNKYVTKVKMEVDTTITKYWTK